MPARKSLSGTHAKLTINIPPHLMNAAKGVAKLEDTSVAELARAAIRAYVLQRAPIIQQELELLNAAAEYHQLPPE